MVYEMLQQHPLWWLVCSCDTKTHAFTAVQCGDVYA